MVAQFWNLAPPPGFQGLRDDLPLRVYTQILPHWRQEGATYFVTFRLDDALPASKLDELRRLRDYWERRLPSPRRPSDDEILAKKTAQTLEEWLDQGNGSCVLRDSAVSQKIVQAMHDSHRRSYELGCYVVMPNHVHAVVRPLFPREIDLEDVLKRWKGRSAREINLLLSQTGVLWQRDSYDRLIRDEEHLWNVIQYIGRNPAKAGVPAGTLPLWINPDWASRGWNFAS
jgi:putative transposase